MDIETKLLRLLLVVILAGILCTTICVLAETKADLVKAQEIRDLGCFKTFHNGRNVIVCDGAVVQ